MRTRDFEQQRANALVNAFLSLCGRGAKACDSMRLAAEQPSPRFWISARQASLYLRKKCIPKPNGLVAQMMKEIEKRCGGDFSTLHLEDIVEQPAPKFYIRPETARKIIQQELKRRRKCRRKQ